MKIKTVTVVFFAALIASTAPAFADIEDVLIGAWAGTAVDRPVRLEFIIEKGAGPQRRRIIFCSRLTPDARSLAIGIIEDASQTITVVKGPQPREEVRNALDLTWGRGGRWDTSETGVFYRPFNRPQVWFRPGPLRGIHRAFRRTPLLPMGESDCIRHFDLDVDTTQTGEAPSSGSRHPTQPFIGTWRGDWTGVNTRRHFERRPPVAVIVSAVDEAGGATGVFCENTPGFRGIRGSIDVEVFEIGTDSKGTVTADGHELKVKRRHMEFQVMLHLSLHDSDTIHISQDWYPDHFRITGYEPYRDANMMGTLHRTAGPEGCLKTIPSLLPAMELPPVDDDRSVLGRFFDWLAE